MKIPFFSKRALSSICITVFIIPIIFFAIPPKKADAGLPVFDWSNVVQNTISATTGVTTAVGTTVTASTAVSNFLKTYVLDTVATAFARAILRKITAQTVNWINTGFKGNPAFVTDPEQFFLDVGDRTASQYFLGANSPLNQLCTAFQPQVRLALVKSYLQEDQFQSQCTFGKIGANFESFTKDFSQGGWEAWFVMTQENQNNPYGAYIDASKQLSARVAVQNTKYDKQLTQGKGFLSFEVCPEGKTYAERSTGGLSSGAFCSNSAECKEGLVCGSDMTCQAITDENFDIDGVSNFNFNPTDCTVAKKVVTPGSVISEKLTKSLNSDEATLELTNSINQVISALIGQMVSQTFNSIQGGLRGLSKKQAGKSTTLLEQVQASSTQAAYQAERAAIEATLPAQFQPALTGGEPTGIYTPPSEAAIRAQTSRDRALYACEISGGYNLEATPDSTGTVPATGIDTCAKIPTDPAESTPI